MRLLRMIGPPFLALGACGDPLARVGRVWEGPVLPAAETERGAKDLFGWLHDVSIAEAAPEAIAGVRQGTDESAVLDLDTDTRPENARFKDTEIAALAPEVIAPGKATGPGAAPTRRSLSGRTGSGQNAGLALHDVSLDAQLPVGEMGRVRGAGATDLGTLVDQAARKGAGHRLYDSAPESLRRPLWSSARPDFTNSCAKACR